MDKLLILFCAAMVGALENESLYFDSSSLSDDSGFSKLLPFMLFNLAVFMARMALDKSLVF